MASGTTSHQVINLDLSRNARPFRPGEDLWKNDRNRMLRLIRRHLNLVKDNGLRILKGPDGRGEGPGGLRRRREDEPLLSIAIFGPSGSGKSSFLYTLVDILNSENNFSSEHDEYGNMPGRIYSLPVINPKDFADDDDFLYAFLAAALEESEEQRENDDREEQYAALSAVKHEFNEVSKYLHVLDRAPSTKEYDPLGVSLERLERHTSGLRLKKKFRKLIETLARNLTRGDDSVIILPVDDADLSVERLVPTLRSYRTYLLHSQLVPVFTFTDRMAEEVLRVQYQRNISADFKAFPENGTSGQIDRLDISRQMALQFLANCFPVRNRIRLGPAPALVQGSRYTVSRNSSDSSESSTGSILCLITTASFLLYGHPDRDTSHNARSALRPSTLRRQLQVADAMIDAGVEGFIVKQFQDMAGSDSKDVSTGLSQDKDWVVYFSSAAWSLFNVHRDVLREFDLDLEDLYSWTRLQLRRVVLDTILAQNRAKRQALLQRWRSRSDERRSQVISLLAAEAFRPWMEGEEPVGDVQRSVKAIYRKTTSSNDQGLKVDEISVGRGIVWFLNLIIGFYQPLILARNRYSRPTFDRHSQRRLTGIGWDLRYGPINAIRAADSNQEIFSTGMMFVDPERFATAINRLETAELVPEDKKSMSSARAKTVAVVSRNELFLRLWSSYGYRKGRFWAAVSLWRGLGLIGRLLEASDAWVDCNSMSEDDRKDYLNHLKDSWVERLEARKEYLGKRLKDEGLDSAEDSLETGRLQDELKRVESDLDDLKGMREDDLAIVRFDREKVIQGLIRTHSISGMVPRSFLGQQKEDERLYVGFRAWDTDEQKTQIREMAKEIYEWLEDIESKGNVSVMPTKDGRIFWRDCFMRRLHGEYIVGDLLPRMNLTYIESLQKSEVFWGESDEDLSGYRSNAWIALGRWARVLLLYWEGCEKVFDSLKTCPILRPLRKLKDDPEQLKLFLNVSHEDLLAIYRHIAGEEGALTDAKGIAISLGRWKTSKKQALGRQIRTLQQKIKSPDLEDKAVDEIEAKLKSLNMEVRGVEEIVSLVGTVEGDVADLRKRLDRQREELEGLTGDQLEPAEQEVELTAKALHAAIQPPLQLLQRTMLIRLFCKVQRVRWAKFEASSQGSVNVVGVRDYDG